MISMPTERKEAENPRPKPGFYYRGSGPIEGKPVNKDAYEVLGTTKIPMIDQTYVLYRPLFESDKPPVQDFFETMTVWAFTSQAVGSTLKPFKLITDPAVVEMLKAIRDTMYPKTAP
jgi:hypothetical protein